jgi:hypothetical protein
MKRVPVEIGEVYGIWTVESVSNKKLKSKSICYWCRCNCGTRREVSGVSLKKGLSKSCGCLPGKRATSKKMGPPGEATFNSLESSYRGAAKGRKLEFSLTRDQFRKIITSICGYCGEKSRPTNVYVRSRWGVTSSNVYKTYKKVSEKAIAAQWINANGIDRRDNSKGYTIDNCVPCCIKCNIGKMNGSAEEFVEHCKKVAEFQGKKNAT